MSSLYVRRNQRREIRRAVRVPCRIVDERAFRPIGDRAIDISPEGMLVPTDARLELGESVIVSFRATDLGIWFDTDAEVARIIHGRRPGDIGRCIGLRFQSLSAVHRLILRGYYRHVPPPLPKRAQRIDYAATIRMLAAQSTE
jgi:hypothetical protein